MFFWVSTSLVICLAVAFPFLDKYIYKKLEDGSWPKNRVLLIGIIWTWLLSVGIYFLLRSDGANLQQIGFIEPNLGQTDDTLKGLLTGVLIGIVSVPFMPLIMSRTKNGPALIRKQVQGFKALLPKTPFDRVVFAGLSVTAGTCEELIYRGFLFYYFANSPYQLSGIVLVIVCALIFGIAHAYQGIRGIISTAVMGFCFGWIYLETGSLVIPMILHTAIDLKLCFVPGNILNEEDC